MITVSANQIESPVAISGAIDDEPIIVLDINNQEWRLVATDAQNCLFEAVEHREIGNAPRIRTMPLKAVQALYGWNKCKYIRPLVGEQGIEVYCGDARYGYALAEPIWAYRESDKNINLDFERERMARMWDRDSDRAANFAMSGTNTEYKGWF